MMAETCGTCEHSIPKTPAWTETQTPVARVECHLHGGNNVAWPWVHQTCPRYKRRERRKGERDRRVEVSVWICHGCPFLAQTTDGKSQCVNPDKPGWSVRRSGSGEPCRHREQCEE